jgi:hypothetical protein
VDEGSRRSKPETGTRERLRRLFVQRAEAIRAAALAADGQVDEREVASLERLHRLLQMEAAAPRTRRPMLVLVSAVLVVVSVLLFSRVSATDIELRAATSELRFTTTSAQPLTPMLRLQSVAVAGASRVEGLPRPSGPGGASPGVADAFRIGLRNAEASSAVGSLNLEPISVPAGARLEFEPIEAGTALRMSVTSKGLVLRISASGQLGLERGGRSAEEWSPSAPQAIDVHCGAGRVDLVLRLQGGAAAAAESLGFEAPLPAAAGSFLVVDRRSLGEVTLLRQVSTLQRGTLRFESLQGRALDLHEGQHLEWRAAQGVLERLQWKDQAVEFRYTARVEALASGEAPNRRDLMPTWLEWLQARHGLWLLWGSAVSGFGVLLAVLRWWGLRL